jgi:hypothetical protein
MRKIMNRYSTQVLLFLFMLTVVARADDLSTNTDQIVFPPNFGEMSYGDADKAVGELIRSVLVMRPKSASPEFVSGLVNQLRQGKLTDEKKVLVVYLLGAVRPKDTDSVEVLIENIDLKAPRMDMAYDIPRWGPYPAQDALIRIGVPAINPILGHLPGEGNELRRSLMCGVLKSVERKETAVGQLKQQLILEANTAKRANLESSLKELEK